MSQVNCKHHCAHEIETKEFIICITGGLFLFFAYLLARLSLITEQISIILYIIAYSCCSEELLREALHNIRQRKFRLNIDFLMLVAALGAASIGEWVEGGLLLFLFSLAHALQNFALNKARNAIHALQDLAPTQARVLRSGVETVIAVEEVVPGDLAIVLPDEKISIDGMVTHGISTVNQAAITGESIPVEKKVGDEIFAGTVNGSGTLTITITRAGNDRMLDRIIRLVGEAQTHKAQTQVFTENFERIFVPVVLISSALVIIIPPITGLLTFNDSFYRAMSLLVGASPCALALGTPSAVLAGIAQAARNGVLIKGGTFLEQLGVIQSFAFDKTGTLTIGEPIVTDVIPLDGVSSEELLRIAAAVEHKSVHPLAHAVVQKAISMKIKIPIAENVESLTARGIRSNVEGKRAEVGTLRLWQSENIVIPANILKTVSDLQEKGKTIVVVKHGTTWLGVMGANDLPRMSAKSVLSELRMMGINSLVMLTGDNKGIADAIGTEVGVDTIYADLSPEDKANAIKELQDKYSLVAMVGDGVNDAPALAFASVGISMGGASSAVALETADISLMGGDLSKLPYAIGLSRKARTIIKQNIIIALFVISLLIVCTTSGMFGMGVAVILHEGSTMVVILNSLRLLRYTR